MSVQLPKSSGKNIVLFCGPISHPINSGRYIIVWIEECGYKTIGYDYCIHDNPEEDLIQLVRQKNPKYLLVLKGERLCPKLIYELRSIGGINIPWLLFAPHAPWMLPLAKAHQFTITNNEDYVDLLRKNAVENVSRYMNDFLLSFLESRN